MFGVAYVGLLLSFACNCARSAVDGGMVALAALIIVVKMGDTGAYTVGRLIGRHKMAPLISPGKTWKARSAAWCSACVGSWLSFTYLPRGSGRRSCISRLGAGWSSALVVGVAGMLGDLAESLLKRDMGAQGLEHTGCPASAACSTCSIRFCSPRPVAYLCWLSDGRDWHQSPDRESCGRSLLAGSPLTLSTAISRPFQRASGTTCRIAVCDRTVGSSFAVPRASGIVKDVVTWCRVRAARVPAQSLNVRSYHSAGRLQVVC